MSEIIKAYKQSICAMRFIGKKYGDNDRVNGMFSVKWGEWFEKGWFSIIEKQNSGSIKEIYEDDDAYIGLMREKHGEVEYWIGMFMPENAIIPEGFEYIDFAKSELGVCWVYGKEGEVYSMESKCNEMLAEEGFEIVSDWCFERYACPRFTTPDEKGNIILDICFFVK